MKTKMYYITFCHVLSAFLLNGIIADQQPRGVSLVRGEPATYISHGKYRPIGETRFVQLPDKEQWNPPQSRNVQVVPASQLEQPQTPQNVTPSLSKHQKRKQKAYSQGYIDGRNGIQSRYQNVGSFSSRQRQPKQRLAPYTQDERRKKSRSYNPAPQVHRIPSIHSESRPESRSYSPDTQVHRMYPVDSRPLPDSDIDYDGDDYTKNMRFTDSRSTRSSTQSVESLSEHTNPDVNRPSFRALTPKINQHQYETKDGNPNSYGHLQSQDNYSNQNRSINQVNRQAPSFAKSVRSNASRSAVMIPESSAQDIETESLNNQTTPPRYKPQIQRSKQQRSQPNINQRSQPHSPPPFDQRYQPPTVDDNDSDFDGDNQDDHTIFSSVDNPNEERHILLPFSSQAKRGGIEHQNAYIEEMPNMSLESRPRERKFKNEELLSNPHLVLHVIHSIVPHDDHQMKAIKAQLGN